MVKNGGSGFKREMCINDTWVKWDVKVDKTKNVMSFSYNMPTAWRHTTISTARRHVNIDNASALKSA